MNQPTVSILIPVYNAESFLQECFDSIINQSYSNLQIVAIDDGSTDGSFSIMLDYAEKDTRFEIYQQVNQGVSATRNHLLEKVKGDYVLFVDSDDWIELETIEVSMHEIIIKDSDILVFNFTEDITIKQKEAIKRFLEHKDFRGMLWNKLIKRTLFDDCKFNESISYGEDALIIWQILQKVSNVTCNSRSLYHYRIHNSNISVSPFSDKKFSAYYVWKQICADTERYWSQFLDIAKARYAIEMTLLLRDAAKIQHNNKKKIKQLQQVVKSYSHLIDKTALSSRKMSLFAWIASHSITCTKIIMPFIK